MAYLEDCIKKYSDLPGETKAAFGAPEVIAKITTLEKRYKVKLDFVVLLLAINELDLEDIAGYLAEKFNLEIELADEIELKLRDEILSLVTKKLPASDVAAPEFSLLTLSVKDKKIVLSEAFSENLLTIFNDDQSYLQDLNVIAFQTFNADPNFEDKMTELLYKNQEVLTHKPFIADNEDVTATVARWLKDFIAKNGSDIFSNIVLAKYLTASENAKILDPEERNLLKKLLKLYRNLVFFPDSMKDVPIEEWELFPINRDQVEKVFHPTKLSTPDVSAPIIDHAEADAEATAAAKKILEELENGQTKIMPKEESPEIKSLRAMAEQYPLGSLERRAIESEIKKKL
ncbi:MAG: hypothetical protein WCK37_00575 [Candidatus Falkowbacteria bacterium]